MLHPIEIPDGELVYDAGFLSPDEADGLLALSRQAIAWRRPVVRVCGREVRSPRLAAWYGDADARYTYSGLANTPLPWLPALAELRTRVESCTRERFNGVLANLYRDGGDSVGWHSDDEPELGPEPVIASVSLGARRRFVLRHKKRGRVRPLELWLDHGSLLVMRGQTQQHWRHALPKTRRPLGSRVNLTFRRIVAPPPASAGAGARRH